MTATTATCFRFAILLSHRILGWSRPSSGQRPSRTKGVTLLARVFGMVFMKPPSVAFRTHLLNTYALSTYHRLWFMFLILFLQKLSADRGVVRPHVPISLSMYARKR